MPSAPTANRGSAHGTAHGATLNEAQREAIRYLDGPCMVIAGAGSGKTRVITHKIAHLVNAGMRGSAIAAITFTNKAATEMAERLASLVRLPEGERPLVSTFHSLGVQILRRDCKRLGLKPSFSILDADDALAILQQAIATTDRKLLRAAQTRISLWKNAMLGPDEAAAAARDADEHRVARAFRDYAATLAAYQAVDFDDLIGLPVKLLESEPEVAQAWRERLRYLLVDEYQDTNACQYQLLRLLAGPRNAFTAVGDDDQSIYGWRGATLENLARLQSDYPSLRVIKLEQNYRSSVTILRAANQLICGNPRLHEKRLWSELGIGDPIAVLACDDEESEADSFVMRLQAHKFERRTRFADYAVLYRGNHQARAFEQALRREKIPYLLSGGQSFFERAEIRDLMAYLRLLANDDDDPAFIRAVTTPRRGVGNTTLEALGSYCGQRQVSMFAALFELGFETRVAPRQLEALRSFGDFINRIARRAAREPAGQVLDALIAAIQYREHLFDTLEDKAAAVRWTNVGDFVDWLKKRAQDEGSTLAQLAQSVSLLSQLERKDADADAVRLSTIHAAKGLEFAHVFIVGCEEGLLPHRGGEPEGEDDAGESLRIEEERRLMYVAVTRAQRSLTLSWCRKRKRARDLLARQPSRFIAEMQLDANPGAKRTIGAGAARERLGRLRDLLAPDRGKG
ncbi:MAG: UvrD-helicase domain-containing protein [Burkholderiaceae bacterium]|nr:UvrD-helicase domain-containing protein [Burkholderiaceae bacterium]